MKLKRTLRERKFIKAYIESNGNATEAYLAINPNIKRENAKEYGCRLLQNLNLSNDELLDKMGMTDAYLHQKLDEGLKATKVVSVIPIKPKEAQPNSSDLPEADSKSIEFVDVEDYPTRHKYLDMAYKLKSKYPSEKYDVKVEGELKITNAKQKLIDKINKAIIRTGKTEDSEQPDR